MRRLNAVTDGTVVEFNESINEKIRFKKQSIGDFRKFKLFHVKQSMASGSADESTVYVRGLPSDVVRTELEALFSGIGPVKKVR